MKEKSLMASLGCIDDELVSSAVDYKPTRVNWFKFAVVAACAVLVIGISVEFFVSHIGAHAVDSMRTGVCYELSNIEELSALCGEDLLIGNLDLSEMTVVENALYYNPNRDSEDTGDLRNHILRAESEEISISVCTWFFGDLDSHKNNTLFTPQNTEVYNIDGIDILVVPHPFESLSECFYRYATFEHNDKVYFISAQSNEPGSVIEIIERMLEH